MIAALDVDIFVGSTRSRQEFGSQRSEVGGLRVLFISVSSLKEG
jgi:hypothetical protein